MSQGPFFGVLWPKNAGLKFPGERAVTKSGDMCFCHCVLSPLFVFSLLSGERVTKTVTKCHSTPKTRAVTKANVTAKKKESCDIFCFCHQKIATLPNLRPAFQQKRSDIVTLSLSQAHLRNALSTHYKD